MNMIKAVLAVSLLGIVPTHASAQQSAAKPCAAGAFRQFDFWVGEWDVHDKSGKQAGRNTITSEQDGCVLIERWKSARGGTGMSMNHYDPEAGVWRQHWVGLGIILEMSGGLQAGAMVLEGPLQYLTDKRVTLLRGVWTALPDGRVRQHFTESSDGGKTWTEWFDGYYTRAAKPQ
jgi:hypothetical protein